MTKGQIIWNIATIIFVLSLVYEAWILYTIIHAYLHGMNMNWFITSLGSDEMVYGIEAVHEALEKILLFSVLIYFPAPIYQIVYIILSLIIKFKKGI